MFLGERKMGVCAHFVRVQDPRARNQRSFQQEYKDMELS